MKKILRIFTILSISATSIVFLPSAQATHEIPPTSVTAVALTSTTAEVTFVMKADYLDWGAFTANSAITVTSSPGGITATSTVGAIVNRIGTVMVSGLTPGETYTFTVKFAYNYYSMGTWVGTITSQPSNSITTPGVPDAPTSVVATATGKRSATVSFEAPTPNGSSTILSYTITSSTGGFTKTLTQEGGGTFTFDNLQPSTAYTFSVVATNAIGDSTATTSNSITTTALDVASLSSLSFVSDGTGTGGKLVWEGQKINSVRFTGPETAYPGPFNYGTATSDWNGRIRNLTPNTSYTVSVRAISIDGLGESKSLTFTTTGTPWPVVGVAKPGTNRSQELAAQLPRLFSWIDENTFVSNEGVRMKRLLSKFQATEVLSGSPYLRLTNSRVAKVSVTSLTTSVCTVSSGLKIKSLSVGACTISYTVTDVSRASATLVKDFVFKKFTD